MKLTKQELIEKLYKEYDDEGVLYNKDSLQPLLETWSDYIIQHLIDEQIFLNGLNKTKSSADTKATSHYDEEKAKCYKAAGLVPASDDPNEKEWIGTKSQWLEADYSFQERIDHYTK